MPVSLPCLPQVSIVSLSSQRRQGAKQGAADEGSSRRACLRPLESRSRDRDLLRGRLLWALLVRGATCFPLIGCQLSFSPAGCFSATAAVVCCCSGAKSTTGALSPEVAFCCCCCTATGAVGVTAVQAGLPRLCPVFLHSQHTTGLMQVEARCPFSRQFIQVLSSNLFSRCSL